MKKSISGTLSRARRFPVLLIGEGLLVGGIGGFVVVLYRMALDVAGDWLDEILAYAGQTPWRMAGWFLVLGALAWLVSRLVSWEPLISGSGIPQLEGEMAGKLEQKWYRVLPAKFLGGFLCLLGGLALGREGPSIQLGAMAGKGISRGLDRGKTEEKFLLTCGAGAGLSAAFHAPLAGVMFSLEEVHKNFSVSALLSVMTASLTADFLATAVLGTDSVFQFTITRELPVHFYWMVLGLGVVLGVLGAFYNWFTLKVQSLYDRATFLNSTGRILIPFFCAGVLGFTAPELLGSGHDLIEKLTSVDMLLGTAVFLLVGRFLFSAVSFGSGAPGGIFFPLLVLGGYMGGIFAMAGIRLWGLDPVFLNNFVLLAMAGYFAAVVRAPLTGIILIFEMTGTLTQMLSLSVVSIVAYVTATLLGSRPIYESLLDRLLLRRGEKPPKEQGEKMLMHFAVSRGSRIEDLTIGEVRWPENCLLVAVERGSQEIIPRGKTRLLAGDVIVTMTDERDEARIHDEMEELCREMF
ncbi:MAG TPA: ClC family H(+)/Cl(-) exchange transporter [Candidatus Dorea merdavium]|nr:ClC family H(+)/Cl(-) exchange transporter [Candidatus Dorea merdavium]